MVMKTLHTYRVSLATALGCVALLMLVGCAGNPKFTDYHAFIQEPRLAASAAPYQVGPPDILELKSGRVKELNNFRQVITPDGFINVPLLGRLYVAGRTVDSIQRELEQRAQFYYQDADVNVRVSQYASKKMFVFGQVSSPGAYFYNGSNTILDMLAQSRPTDLADPSSVLIVRPDENGELRARMTINLDEMIRTGNTSLNAVLQEGDIIYVPPTRVAKFTLGLRQILLPIAPLTQTINGPGQISVAANGQRPYGDSD